jgi:hypothetical protein
MAVKDSGALGSVRDYPEPMPEGAFESRRLCCEECGGEATAGAWGWRGYRIDDPEEGDVPEIGFFCPDCAEREFGPPADSYDWGDSSQSESL